MFGVVGLIVVLGSTLVAQANGWQWPNGGQLTEHQTVQRPDGGHEVLPSRCILWEDGSAICGSWEQSREELEQSRAAKASEADAAKAATLRLQVAIKALRADVHTLAQVLQKASQP